MPTTLLAHDRRVDPRVPNRAAEKDTASTTSHGPPGPDVDDVLDALANPTPRAILATLMAGPRSVRDVSKATGIPLATTYRHVTELQDRNLVYRTRSAISGDGKRYDLFDTVLQDVNLDLGSEGIRLRWTIREAAEERIRNMWEQVRL